MPPVRLPSEEELAREALASPLFARAVRLARWVEPGTEVGASGELPDDLLLSAVSELGLEGTEGGQEFAADAWHFAIDTGLVEITGAAPDDDTEAIGNASPGPDLELVAEGDPGEILDLWSVGLDAVLADAAAPTFEELLGEIGVLDGSFGADGEIDPDTIDADALEWDQEEAAGHLDAALGSLYLFAVTDEAGQAASMVPLPMVAAASVVPEDMDELSPEALDELSAAVLKLDGQFGALSGTGLLEYRPVDDSVLEEAEEGDAGGHRFAEDERRGDEDGEDDEDLTRYGLARLTPLGLYGVRRRMLDAGLDVPLIGELAERDATVLLAVLPHRPEPAAREEAELWLARREPADAARSLLAAARGTDSGGPGRRLGCQLVLSMLDGRAEPALREVLDDGELGGLARVWLADSGAADVPPPDETMVFWLTIDTLAAQLGDGVAEEEADELSGLVGDLVGQHSGFFDRAWRTGHPATADVLEAVGRLHPDKQLAKQARKAAFKARSLH
ncbi:hypothetical protein [Streptomyces marincola]|uniref:hypothetical protein n=1 Tax=Streptomyces marincola TaxID=2878388 RepID=UPI001CF2F05E|nr:hypothetical protein [Streptomyces marincola]UCM91705.1 hypothetical protein LC193_04395 [Streptomyces marincola]